MIVTIEDLKSARTVNKGYSKEQVEYAQKLTSKSKWRQELIGMKLTDEQWLKFVQLGEKTKLNSKREKKGKRKKIINTFSKSRDGWFWKPKPQDIPEIKTKGMKAREINKKANRRKRLSRKDDADFYSSREWKALRVRVLERYECRCMMCGRSPKEHGVVIHVDHIKPRSKYPELSLEFSNLQLLCDDCNFGKGNKYETDYRPDILSDEDREILLGAIINQ